MLTLNRLLPLRHALVALRRAYLRLVFGMDIHPTAQFSLSASFDRTNPKGVHVGRHSWVALRAVVLSHDFTRGLYLHTRIGERCFIGAGSTIMPGVTIGDGSLVAAGSVVTHDVPPRCVVAGNPARIIREEVDLVAYGRFRGAPLRTRPPA